MKITEVKTWLVEGAAYNWTLIKIFTDVGLTGIGEATNWPGSPMIASACQFIGKYLIGQDPSRIDSLWTKLYKEFHWMGHGGILLSAISAVDIALWASWVRLQISRSISSSEARIARASSFMRTIGLSLGGRAGRLYATDKSGSQTGIRRL